MTPARLVRLRLRVRRLLAVPAERALMRLLPPEDLSLVAGLPDSEENSLVCAVRLAATARGRVVLLAADEAAARRQLQRVAAQLGDAGSVAGVEVVRKGGLRTVLLFCRARVVFYTHGLYDSPRPTRGRVHVNLWHGTGPKWSGNARTKQRIGAQVLSTASPVWGAETARALSMGPGVRLAPGNTRQDLLVVRARADRTPVLRAVGLEPRVPLVLWLPTFRVSHRAGRTGLRDGEPLERDDLARRLGPLARAANVQLVVKPHRLDAARYERLGITVITDDVLDAAGLGLSDVVAASAAMLSDYSSAWVDFLALDRPLALYCPDLATYVSARGLNEPALDVVAGPLMLGGERDAVELFAAVQHGKDFRPAARRSLERSLGVDDLPDRTGRMLLAADQLLFQTSGRHFLRDGPAITSS